MARYPRCRVCATPGQWICEACGILERDAKSRGVSLRREGIIDDDWATSIRQHETNMPAKGHYG